MAWSQQQQLSSATAEAESEIHTETSSWARFRPSARQMRRHDDRRQSERQRSTSSSQSRQQVQASSGREASTEREPSPERHAVRPLPEEVARGQVWSSWFYHLFSDLCVLTQTSTGQLAWMYSLRGSDVPRQIETSLPSTEFATDSVPLRSTVQQFPTDQPTDSVSPGADPMLRLTEHDAPSTSEESIASPELSPRDADQEREDTGSSDDNAPQPQPQQQQQQVAGPLFSFTPAARPQVLSDSQVIVLGKTKSQLQVSSAGLLQAVSQLPRGEHYSKLLEQYLQGASKRT